MENKIVLKTLFQALYFAVEPLKKTLGALIENPRITVKALDIIHWNSLDLSSPNIKRNNYKRLLLAGTFFSPVHCSRELWPVSRSYQ
jgi:hypothetical protein